MIKRVAVTAKIAAAFAAACAVMALCARFFAMRFLFFVPILMVFAGLSGAYAVCCLAQISKNKRVSAAGEVLRRTMEICVFAGLIVFIAFEALILSGAKSDAKPGAGTVIVLGAGLIGENPSAVLESRLESALDYLEQNPQTLCIVSGGQGENEVISEAEAMSRWLIKRGILPERIVKEDKSSNTNENLMFSQGMISENAGIVIISSDFHLYRAKKLTELHGYKDVSVLAAKTPGFLVKTAYLIREAFSVLKMELVNGV